MSILVIQGPHSASRQLHIDAIGVLDRLARSAGRTLETVSIATLRELVARLRSARPGVTEFVLIDPGALAADAIAAPEELRQVLEALPVPFIEIHDCSDTTLEIGAGTRAQPVATIIINQDLAMSYRIALGIALRRLGATCAGATAATASPPLSE